MRPQRFNLAEHESAATHKSTAESLQLIFFVISMLDFAYRLSGRRTRKKRRLGVGGWVHRGEAREVLMEKCFAKEVKEDGIDVEMLRRKMWPWLTWKCVILIRTNAATSIAAVLVDAERTSQMLGNEESSTVLRRRRTNLSLHHYRIRTQVDKASQVR